MGMSKALMEKIAVAKARSQSKTIISVTRYGNVLFSRGSVVPLFRDKILNNFPLPITEPSMTRFIMTLKEAMDLVFLLLRIQRAVRYLFKNHPHVELILLL